MNPTTVFPVGHYGGHYRGRDGGTRSGDEHLIRVGRRMEQLTDDEFGVWMLAHGIAEAGDGSWTRDKICDRAGDAEIAGPAACFDRLLERALLAVVPTGADRVDEAVDFATAYRLRSLLVGLGIPPDRPGRHAIGVPGVGTAALLDEGSYRLWQWGAMAPSLWHHCEDRIRSAGDPSTPEPHTAAPHPGRPNPAAPHTGRPNPAAPHTGRPNTAAPHAGGPASAVSTPAGLDTIVDPARVLTDVLAELRVLLVHGCAYLDAVPDPLNARDEVGAGLTAG